MAVACKAPSCNQKEQTSFPQLGASYFGRNIFFPSIYKDTNLLSPPAPPAPSAPSALI
ncbi:MAG: hypothetical protein F6K31_34665 [Symploca sp. SIO2G7]|nr:hypothetical protein [Symploca sp. SIO2G7]